MEAAFQRNISPGHEFDHLFPKPSFIRKDYGEGPIGQTIDAMWDQIITFQKDTEEIAKLLKGKTFEETIRNVWEFNYNHYQYALDKEGEEQLRRPAVSWHERETGIDCDCFTINISTMLLNLGIEPIIRIVKIPPAISWHHVYPIVKDPKTNRYYVLDAVVDKFNHEESFGSKSNKKDFFMNNLGIPIVGLNGPSDNADLLSGVSGKGQDKVLNHLVATRNLMANNPEESEGITDNPSLFVKELDYAIKHWNTPLRAQALEALAERESKQGLSGEMDPSDFENVHSVESFDRAIKFKLDFVLVSLEYEENEQKRAALSVLSSHLQAIYKLPVSHKEIAVSILMDIAAGRELPEDTNESYELIEDYLDQIEDIEDDILLMDQQGLHGASLGAFWNKRSKRLAKREKRQQKRYKKAVTKGKGKRANRLKSSIDKTKLKSKGKSTWKKEKKNWQNQNERGFWNSVKKGVNSYKKYNPVMAAGRGGFMLLLKVNLLKIKSRLKWGLATEAQAKAKGMDSATWKKRKKAMDKLLKFWKSYGGKPSKLKTAFLKGKKGSLEGMLGEAVTATVSAATAVPVVVKAVDIMSEAGLLDKKEKEGDGKDDVVGEDGKADKKKILEVIKDMFAKIKNKVAPSEDDAAAGVADDPYDEIDIEGAIDYDPDNDPDDDGGLFSGDNLTYLGYAAIGLGVLGGGYYLYTQQSKSTKKNHLSGDSAKADTKMVELK